MGDVVSECAQQIVYDDESGSDTDSDSSEEEYHEYEYHHDGHGYDAVIKSPRSPLKENKHLPNPLEIIQQTQHCLCKCNSAEAFTLLCSTTDSTNLSVVSKTDSSISSTITSSYCPQLKPLSKSQSYHVDKEYENNKNCKHISRCKAIKRIIRALKWYSHETKSEEDTISSRQGLLDKILGHQYQKYLLDDYHHLLNHHLVDNNPQHDGHNEFQLIQKEINKRVDPCDVNKCVGYKRFHSIAQKDLSVCDEAKFCIDFMDLIHCYLMHNQYI